MDALPEPVRLDQIKAEVQRRWGTLDLLDVLKDSDFLCEFTSEFASTASREVIDRDVLRRRLLLALFALGTNMGIKGVVSTGEHGETETALRYVRRHYITRDNLRRAITRVVNATFDARDPRWWGTGTACASDSKKFGSWESNLMTEWHNRYGGPGVMIYWHVERRSMCIYSQLKNCSSSEVAAMIEGLLRHDSDVPVENNYVDTHGASIVGFAFTELLGFRLLPRLKNIGSIRLYRPDDTTELKQLEKVTTRPTRWDLIAQQYDQMIRATPRHHRRGDDPATLHEGRTETPDLPGPRRTRPGRPNDLRRRVPRRPRPTTRDPRRPASRRAMELRERHRLLPVDCTSSRAVEPRDGAAVSSSSTVHEARGSAAALRPRATVRGFGRNGVSNTCSLHFVSWTWT